MECDSFRYDHGTYYRVLVNDSPESLMGCSDGPADSCSGIDIGEWLSGRAEVVENYGT